MAHVWIALADCPVEGRRLRITDQAVWAEPIAEFGLNAELTVPLAADVDVMPHKDGLLIRGRVQGAVGLVCDRCAESMPWPVDTSFDVFEDLEEDDDADAPSARFRQGREGLEIDLGAVLWEQFILDLPVKPLCAENCRGICPQCGANLNHGDCGCDRGSLDPRLEVLRRLKVDDDR